MTLPAGTVSNHYAARSDAYHQYLEGIAPQAYDAYKSCIEYSHAQVKFHVTEGSVKPRELLIFAQYASAYRDLTYAFLRVQPSAGVSCRWSTSSSSTAKVHTGSGAELHCTRTFQGDSSFVSILNTNDAATPPFVLPWAAYAADGTPIDTLRAVQSALSDLKSEVTRVSAEARKSAEELERMRENDAAKPEIGGSGNYETHPYDRCGKGQFVSAVHWWFYGAAEKLLRITFECRDAIPPPSNPTP